MFLNFGISKQKTSVSKFLNLVLRHSPETIGIALDSNEWADIEELLRKSALHNIIFTKKELEVIVIDHSYPVPNHLFVKDAMDDYFSQNNKQIFVLFLRMQAP